MNPKKGDEPGPGSILLSFPVKVKFSPAPGSNCSSDKKPRSVCDGGIDLWPPVRSVLREVLAQKQERKSAEIQFDIDEDADPLEPIRKNRKAVESIAEEDRDDGLDAVAKCLLAVVDGREPDPKDCKVAGLESLAEELNQG